MKDRPKSVLKSWQTTGICNILWGEEHNTLFHQYEAQYALDLNDLITFKTCTCGFAVLGHFVSLLLFKLLGRDNV